MIVNLIRYKIFTIIIYYIKATKYIFFFTYQLVHVVPSGDVDISIVVFPVEPGLTTAGDAKAKNFGSLLKRFLTTAIRTSMGEKKTKIT